MTLQEYENEIKELKERIEKLEAEKVEEPQSKRWEPNAEELYWAVGSDGNIGSVIWDNDNYDNWQYQTGNCFKTKEEAEEYKKQIEYTARYKNYIEEHNDSIDWCDTEQAKFYVLYGEDRIIFDDCYSFKGMDIYASSEEIIKDAIKEIGEDNFKKYVLGVK